MFDPSHLVSKTDVVQALGLSHKRLRGNCFCVNYGTTLSDKCSMCERWFANVAGIVLGQATCRRGGDGRGRKCKFCLLAMWPCLFCFPCLSPDLQLTTETFSDTSDEIMKDYS